MIVPSIIEYVLLYVDDALCVSEFPKEALLETDNYYPMKRGSIGPPNIYLGKNMNKVQLPNGALAWSLSMSQKSMGLKLPLHTQLPMDKNYDVALEQSEFLNEEDANYYQSVIGILRWMVEMGRMDITTEVTILSSYVAS